MKNIVVILGWSRFPVKLLLLVVYLNLLLLLSYNDLWNNGNLAENLLCNYLLDYLQSFECYHMFILYCLLVDQKVSSISHDIVIFNFYIWIKKICVWPSICNVSVFIGVSSRPQKHQPPKPTLNLRTVQTSYWFLVNSPKNRIFQWTPKH